MACEFSGPLATPAANERSLATFLIISFHARYINLEYASAKLVSCGQTAISAQGVYRLQYKRPHRKGSGGGGGGGGGGGVHSADLVFTLSNVSIY